MAELKVKISADVVEATQGMTAVEQRAKQLEANIAKLNSVIGNTTSQQKLTSALSALKQQQSELAKVSQFTADKSGQLASVTNQATYTMSNFTRVVQDAPFGIRGIANNIDPLVESFTKLQKQTGSTGAALKSMVATLAGRAGLLLAVSTVTSILVKFGDDIFGSGEAAKKAKTNIDDFNESINNTKARSIATSIELKKFVDIAKNQNAPLSQRNEALRKANSILGEYGEKLTIANVATEKAIKLTNDYSEGILQQALATAFSQRIADLTLKQVDAQDKLNKAQERYNKASEAYRNRPPLTVREQELGKGTQFLIDKNIAFDELNKAQKEFEATTGDIYQATGLFNTASAKATQLLGSLGVKTRELNKELKETDKLFSISRVMLLKFPTEGFTKAFRDETIRIESNFNQMIMRLQEKMRTFDPLNLKRFTEKGQDIINYFKPIFEVLDFQNLTGFQRDRANEAIAMAKEITPAFENMIQNIARGENAFKSFGQAVGQIMTQVAQKIISTAILATLLSAIPGFGQATGATGFGGIFAKLLGFRANGGPVSGGNPYVVGERGPELFVPSVSGSIVPNNSVGSFMGGRMGDGGGRSSVLRGQDILLAYARTQRSQLRVNG